MAESQTYTGTVASVERKGNAKTYKVTCTNRNGEYLNERKFIVWPTEYQSEDPNPNLTKLQASIGQVVTIQYTTKQKEWQGKSWPENTIHEVDVVGAGVASPSAPAPAASQSDWGVNVAPVPSTQTPAGFTAFADILDATAQDIKKIADELRHTKVSADF